MSDKAQAERSTFCECEECVDARKWIVEKTGVGGGARPLSFLIASHDYMATERDSAFERGRERGIEEAAAQFPDLHPGSHEWIRDRIRALARPGPGGHHD